MSNTRASIRKMLANQRQQLSPQILNQAAGKICAEISNTAWFNKSTHIAFYQAVRGELPTQPLIALAWKLGKTCYLPVCEPTHSHLLRFVPYFPNDPLLPNRYGILEPSLKTRTPLEPSVLDIAFLPLTAFDHHGNRLGSGKGYYDRTFAYLKEGAARTPDLIGLAYAFQEIPEIEAEEWDIPLQKTIVFDTKRNIVMVYNF